MLHAVAALLYVRASALSQRLLLGPAHPATGVHDRALLALGALSTRDRGHERHHTTQGRLPEDRRAHPRPRASEQLTTTALATTAAYVAALGAGGSRILVVGR